MPDTSELLARFHHALVGEIRESRPDYLHSPFTVAEIYQNLVPYRSHRDVIGVEMNGDYEDALLRLLAGEGDYLFLESDVARREIRAELQTGNPNTGLFRDFAAADVRLNPVKIDFAGPVLVEEATAFEPAQSEPLAEDSDGTDGADSADAISEGGVVELGDFTLVMDRLDDVAVPEMVIMEPDEDPEEDEIASAEEGPDLADSPASALAFSCQWCRAELPEREEMKFCPFCGGNLDLVSCTGCGEELESHWRFCIACGTEAPA